MSKGGRPKKEPEERRTKTIGVRVSPEEYLQLESKARDAGITPTELLRRSALNKRIVPRRPPINAEAHRLLRSLSNNINQIAVKTHLALNAPGDLLRDVELLVDEIRERLVQ